MAYALQFENEEDRQLGSTTQESPNDQGMYAILFPWFAQTIAVFIYYIISRYLTVLPYTAIVFLFGVVYGAVLNPSLTENKEANAIAYSAAIWLNIDGLVILLVFLPGLIFNDSYTINVHLFFQCEDVCNAMSRHCNILSDINLCICLSLLFSVLVSMVRSILATDYFCVSNGKAKITKVGWLVPND
jgi:hypothetical protein